MEKKQMIKSSKPVNVSKEYCHDCGEMLKGVGSKESPYHCSCGEWKWDYENKIYYTEV